MDSKSISATVDDEKILTIFIPSYNRMDELKSALNSIFKAIQESRYSNFVDVMVVDDYSSEQIEMVINEQRYKGNKLSYYLHRTRYGVAELSMLNCLNFISTKYAWCIGNDDTLLTNAIDSLIPILQKAKSSFLLLNFIGQESNGSTYDYLLSEENEIVFNSGFQLFSNFGFVTATTTFPCLCFEVEPLKRLELSTIMDISPIYSHTAALFCAFYKSQCSFLPKPLVIYNHNTSEEEHRKLESKNHIFNRFSFFHASVGLIRHLKYISILTGTPIEQLARCNEDEIKKDSKKIKRTMTAFFIFHSSVQQLVYELQMSNSKLDTIHVSRKEIEELQSFFDGIKIPELAQLFIQARSTYCVPGISLERRIARFVSIKNQAFNYEKKYLFDVALTKQKSSRLIYGDKSGFKLLTSGSMFLD